jgi:hypothetical protein
MGERMPSEEKPRPPILGKAARHHIRFVAQVADGQAILMEFVDPAPAKAVRVLAESNAVVGDTDAMDILTVPGQPNDDPGALEEMIQWVNEAHRPEMAPPITITLHGTQVVWHTGRVAILAAPERMDALMLALVDFGFYERELGKLERATADAWTQLEADSPLAFELAAKDQPRRDSVARQMQRMLNVRMRHARIWPRLYRPGTHLSSLAVQLGERLREKTRIEDRHETLGHQLEAFERFYEMASQRFSEFRASRAETTLEWVIIVLLAAESLLLLIDVLLHMER